MFLLPSFERMMAWREFREGIKTFSEEKQLDEVASLGGLVPTVNYVIDPYKPDTWPTPWELVNKGDFDEASIAYFLEQTLILLGWDEARLNIIIANDTVEGKTKIALMVDEKYLLNWHHGRVFLIDKMNTGCAYLMKYKIVDGQHIFAE